MSGLTSLTYSSLSTAIIVISALVCALTDITRGRIFNFITIPLMVLGPIVAFVLGGAAQGADSLIGILTALLLYGWMFFFGFLGGGDVKLLMAWGAWSQSRFVFDAGVLSVLLGGLMAFLILAVRGNLKNLVRQLYRFLQSLFIKELEVELPKLDKKSQMPFGVPMAIAALWVALGGRVWF